jgi:hypothetical protein
VIRDVISIPVEGYDGNEALELLYRIVDQLMQKVTRPLLGIGVGTPGLVNTQEGIIINAVNLNWQNLPLTTCWKNDKTHRCMCLTIVRQLRLGKRLLEKVILPKKVWS